MRAKTKINTKTETYMTPWNNVFYRFGSITQQTSSHTHAQSEAHARNRQPHNIAMHFGWTAKSYSICIFGTSSALKMFRSRGKTFAQVVDIRLNAYRQCATLNCRFHTYACARRSYLVLENVMLMMQCVIWVCLWCPHFMRMHALNSLRVVAAAAAAAYSEYQNIVCVHVLVHSCRTK